MPQDRQPARVGVRELRQNLSVYLDRVKGGETLEVTEHGNPVAHLAPARAEPISTFERLLGEGRARPALGNLADLGMPDRLDLPPGAPTLSETLARMREEERW